MLFTNEQLEHVLWLKQEGHTWADIAASVNQKYNEELSGKVIKDRIRRYRKAHPIQSYFLGLRIYLKRLLNGPHYKSIYTTPQRDV